MNRFSLAAAAFAALPITLAAQQSPTRVWTPADITTQTMRTFATPTEPVWSPDSRMLTFLDPFSGDLVAVDPATAQVSVLISSAKIDSVLNPNINEKDRDHRSRYNTSSYAFAPDPSHLLFDADGMLWVYDLKTGTGVNVANSGQGSGDDPKFSPDAQFVSYVKGHNLYVRSLHGTPEINLSATHDAAVLNGEVDWVYEEELDTRSNYFWSPDSKQIAYLQANEAKVPQYPITDWIPTHPTIDQQRYPQPGDPNPDVHIGVVSASGGHTTWVKLPISAGNDYIPRFGWLNAYTLWIETLTRDHQHRNIYFADAHTGNAKAAIEESTEKFLDEDYGVMLAPHTGLLLLTSWRDGWNHIYAYRFDKNDPMASGATLTAELDKGSYDVDEVEGMDEARGVVFFNAGETDPRERQVYAAKLDGSGQQQLTHEHGYHKGFFSPDGSNFAEEHSDLTMPPVMNMCAGSGGQCRNYFRNPGVEPGLTVRAPKMIETKAPDGTTLYASLLMPENASAKASVPLINSPYGGPHAQVVSYRYAPDLFTDQLLTEHGFAVLHVDNEGMGSRGRDFAWKAYRNFGPIQLDGQLAAIDQVFAANPQLDPKRLGWWGWSWGGTFTLYAMTHSDRVRAGFAVAPVTSWLNYDSIYTERYMGLPANEAKNYSDFSVSTSAKQLKGRLMIAQGTGDDNVHIQNTVQFTEQLIQAGIPYDLQIYPRKTHSISGVEDRTSLFSRLLFHFETYLK